MSEDVKVIRTAAQTIKLDEKVILVDELQKIRENLPNNQRIVEIKDGVYRTISRLRG